MMQDLSSASAHAFLRNAARVLMGADMNSTGLTNSSDIFTNSADSSTIVDGDSTTNSGGEFDPKVFWSVNAFIFVMVVTMCCFYYHSDKWWFLNAEERRRQSDDVYRRALQERLEQEEARKKETPEQRTRKLLQSFSRHKVQMVRRLVVCCSTLQVPTTGPR